MVDKYYLKEEEKNKEKPFPHFTLLKFFTNKHFVYILNDTRIITKLPHSGIFKIFSNHTHTK